MYERVVERKEIVRVCYANLGKVCPLQVRKDYVAVFFVVDELGEICLLGILKAGESHEVRDTVTASRNQEEMAVLKFHSVPLSPDIKVVSGKHIADGLNIIVLDGRVGNEVLVFLRDVLVWQGKQAVKLKQILIGSLPMLLQLHAVEQVRNLHQCSPVMVFQASQLYLNPSVVSVFQYSVDVNRPVAALLRLLDIVVNSSLNHKRQPVFVSQKPVVQLVSLFGRRHDAAAARNVLRPVDLHLRETDKFTDNRFNPFHAIGANAVVVNLIGNSLYRVEDNRQRLFVAEPERLQHSQILVSYLFRIAPDSVAEPFVVFI